MRKCPNCGHLREAPDTAPVWECPGCGTAYSKYGTVLHQDPHFAHQPLQTSGGDVEPYTPAGKFGGILQLLFWAALFGLALFAVYYRTFDALQSGFIVEGAGRSSRMEVHRASDPYRFWSDLGIFYLFMAMIAGFAVVQAIMVIKRLRA